MYDTAMNSLLESHCIMSQYFVLDLKKKRSEGFFHHGPKTLLLQKHVVDVVFYM